MARRRAPRPPASRIEGNVGERQRERSEILYRAAQSRAPGAAAPSAETYTVTAEIAGYGNRIVHGHRAGSRHARPPL